MNLLNETLFACGVACSALGFQREAGNYEMDMLLANVTKQHVTRAPYEISRLAEDIAGGIICTMPSYADFNSEEIIGDATYWFSYVFMWYFSLRLW